MKAVKMLAACLVAVIVLVGAMSADAKIPGHQMKVVMTDKDANGTVDLAFNGTLTINLASDPAKGTWKIVTQNDKVMKPVVKEGKFLKATKTQVFEFKALNEGTDQLKLDYVGPNGKVTKSFQATIRVGPKDEKATPLKK